MKQFLSVNDAADLHALVAEADFYRKNPWAHRDLGDQKMLGLVFFNSSLRTRLSTQKAAIQLGLSVMVMNVQQDGWQLEFEDGAVMNGGKAEHIREAAAVMGRYCDILGVRAFPGLQDRDADYREEVIQGFVKFAGVPILSLESATRHPLQSLADVLTIETNKTVARPKVVLTWAPHPRALPQAVPNSFSEWVIRAGYEVVIAHPEGYDLAPEFTAGARITHHQDEALQGAHFVYAKNWSSYTDYGKILSQDPAWTLTPEKMALTAEGRFMHCLPVRRNVIVSDAVLDSPASLVVEEAGNRTPAAQAVLARMLKAL
jgi:N-succinyl-L-ornithine transcarbamylase